MILNLDKKAESFEGVPTRRVRISNTNFENLINNAVSVYTNYDELDKKIDLINTILIENFEITFGNRMVNQIRTYVPVYIACGGKEEDAFDDFIAKKILRKLEGKDALKVSNKVDNTIDQIDAQFGKDNMKRSKEYLKSFKIKG